MPPLVPWLRLFRRLCLLAALGSLLLIPLQTQAAVGVARTATSQESFVLQALTRSVQAVRNAESGET